MRYLLAATAGLALGGVWAALAGPALLLVMALVKTRRPARPTRPVLLLILVELRAGRSILAALQQTAAAFPQDEELTRVARVATVRGLTAAVETVTGDTRRLVAQLARAQRSGSPVAHTVRSLLEADLASDRSRRLARARSLPVRLMIPISLLVLPGLVLMFYAPSLIRLLDDLSQPFA